MRSGFTFKFQFDFNLIFKGFIQVARLAQITSKNSIQVKTCKTGCSDTPGEIQMLQFRSEHEGWVAREFSIWI